MDIISKFIFLATCFYIVGLGVILISIKIIRGRNGDYYDKQKEHLNVILEEKNLSTILFNLSFFIFFTNKSISQIKLYINISYQSWKEHRDLNLSLNKMNYYCDIIKRKGGLKLNSKKNLKTLGKNIVIHMNNIQLYKKTFGCPEKYIITEAEITLIQYLADEFNPLD